MGGGGPKMLRAAAAHADIVGINPNLSAGVIDHRAGPDATLERTREKITWIRDAAGDRFGDIELQVRILAGSVGQIADKLRSLNEELGLSYFTWNADDAEALAPIVAELT